MLLVNKSFINKWKENACKSQILPKCCEITIIVCENTNTF